MRASSFLRALVLVLPATALLAEPRAHAGVVHLTNGQEIEGPITEVTDEFVVMTVKGETVKVNRDQVRSIEVTDSDPVRTRSPVAASDPEGDKPAQPTSRQRVRITLVDGSTLEGALDDYGSRTYRVVVEGGRAETVDEGRVRKVEFLSAGAGAEEEADTSVPRVSMEFARADVRIVLDLLGRQSGKYMSIAPDVSGEVSVNVRNVRYDKVLGTICATLGLEFAAGGDGVVTVRRRPASAPRDAETDEQFAERFAREREEHAERVDRERAVNKAALAGLRIGDLPSDPWHAIVAGKQLPPEERFLAIRDAAEAVTRGSGHRFLFRASEAKDDEQDLGGSQYACNLGVDALAAMGVIVRFGGGTLTLERGSRSRTWAVTEKNPARLNLLVSAPGEEVGRPLSVVCATGFSGGLTISRGAALHHGFFPFAVPGTTRLTSAWFDAPFSCERVRVRVRIPELGGDEEIVAAVLPVETSRLTPGVASGPPREPTAAEMQRLRENPENAAAFEELRRLTEEAKLRLGVDPGQKAVLRALQLRDLYTEGERQLEGMRRALYGGKPEDVAGLFEALEAHAKKMVETDAQFAQAAEDLLSQGREMRDRAKKVQGAK